jgi:hypothetical protein
MGIDKYKKIRDMYKPTSPVKQEGDDDLSLTSGPMDTPDYTIKRSKIPAFRDFVTLEQQQDAMKKWRKKRAERKERKLLDKQEKYREENPMIDEDGDGIPDTIQRPKEKTTETEMGPSEMMENKQNQNISEVTAEETQLADQQREQDKIEEENKQKVEKESPE